MNNMKKIRREKTLMKIKTKDKHFLIILTFLIVAICFTSFLDTNNSIFAKAETQTTNEIINLNTDNIAGRDLTIRDYPTQLHATEARIIVNNHCFELDGMGKDDPIVEIVPKNYFLSVGQKLEIGDEYGYYINTESTNNRLYEVFKKLTYSRFSFRRRVPSCAAVCRRILPYEKSPHLKIQLILQCRLISFAIPFFRKGV